MAIVGWVDSDALKAEWWDAPDQAELDALLGVAFEVCLAYAPPLAAGAVVPESWAMAQKLQAKHLFARDKSGNRESVGPDGYTVSTFPLVLEARNLLRPKRSPFEGLL
jgi:hypothetical protein